MTYRDAEDALRARVQALQSKLALQADERRALRQELEQARHELEQLHPVDAVLPSAALMNVGIVACSLTILALMLSWLAAYIGYNHIAMGLVHGLADVGLALAFVGLYRAHRHQVALWGAILLFAGLLDWGLRPLLSGLGGVGRAFELYAWMRNAIAVVLTGIAVLWTPGLPRGLRLTAAVLSFLAAFASTLAQIVFLGLQSATWGDGRVGGETLMAVLRVVSMIVSAVYVGRHVGLLLCFVRLRRQARGGERGGGA